MTREGYCGRCTSSQSIKAVSVPSSEDSMTFWKSRSRGVILTDIENDRNVGNESLSSTNDWARHWICPLESVANLITLPSKQRMNWKVPSFECWRLCQPHSSNPRDQPLRYLCSKYSQYILRAASMKLISILLFHDVNCIKSFSLLGIFHMIMLTCVNKPAKALQIGGWWLIKYFLRK